MGGCFSLFKKSEKTSYKNNLLRLSHVYYIEDNSFDVRKTFIAKAQANHPNHKKTEILCHKESIIAYFITSPPIDKEFTIRDIKSMAQDQRNYCNSKDQKYMHASP